MRLVGGQQTEVKGWTDTYDYPPDQRPDFLKPYHYLKGSISSTPQDLPDRAERLRKLLQDQGWRLAMHPDFEIDGVGEHHFGMLMYKEGLSESDAKSALSAAMKTVDLNYSSLSSWAGEIKEQVVDPTVTMVKDTAIKSSLWGSRAVVAAVGIIGVAWAFPYLMMGYKYVRGQMKKGLS